MPLVNMTQKAVIDCASAADNVLVAASPGKVTYVVSYKFVVGGAVNVTWGSKDPNSNVVTPLTGPMPFGGTGSPGDSASENITGWWQTLAGGALVLTLDGAVQTSGAASYYQS